MGKHIRFDWAMKRLLRNKANFDVLEGLLSELLMQDITIQEILESEGNTDNEGDKYNRADIVVKNQHGHLVLVELQIDRENDYFHRMNYGQARLITNHIDEGQNYENVKKVYSIDIVYFDLGQGDDYVYIGETEFRGMHQQDVLQLNASQKKIYPVNKVSDIFTTYYLLKVNNFDDVAKTTLDEWLYFLKNNEIKDEFRAKGLQEAKEKLRRDNLSPAERENYDQFIKERRISENVFQSYRLEGVMDAEKKYAAIIEEERRLKEEERKQKEEERSQKHALMVKLALKMKKYGESMEDIIKETGLTKAEIDNL